MSQTFVTAFDALLMSRLNPLIVNHDFFLARRRATAFLGPRLAFERREIELHQVLGVKVGEGGVAGMPLRPDWGV